MASAMDASACLSCKQTKGLSPCGSCQGPVCKRCLQVLEDNAFALLEKVPGDLSHRAYCGPCFVGKVAPALDEYERTLALAKGVFVFHKGQGEETRLIKRSEKPLRVVECTDEKETLLRLAFLAAQRGFNALLDVDLTAKKVRNFGYQTLAWQGTGVPARIDGESLERQTKKR